MPLSEEELRLLEQMERALVEEDPKLASTLRGTAFRRAARRRADLAGACFVLGVVVLMTGAVASITGRRHRRLRDHAGLGHRGAHRHAWSARPGRRGRPAQLGASQPRRLHRHRRWPFRQDPSLPSHLVRLLHGPDGGPLASPPRRGRVLAPTANLRPLRAAQDARWRRAVARNRTGLTSLRRLAIARPGRRSPGNVGGHGLARSRWSSLSRPPSTDPLARLSSRGRRRRRTCASTVVGAVRGVRLANVSTDRGHQVARRRADCVAPPARQATQVSASARSAIRAASPPGRE